jgi:hypothetical protein
MNVNKYFLAQVQLFNGNTKNRLPFSFISHNKVETNKHINRLCISGFCFVSEIDIS